MKKDTIEVLLKTLLATIKEEDSRDVGYIVFKKENHTRQVFFSDHKPVDGVDEFGHSTKDKERFLREAYRHETFEEAFADLMGMINREPTQLRNDVITDLGIYSVEEDEVVYQLHVTNTCRGDEPALLVD